MPGAAVEHFKLAVGLATEALKSLIFVNGGAATALIALMNSASYSADFSIAALVFGLSSLLNAITMAVGYLSQLSYANSIQSAEYSNNVDASKFHKTHGICQTIAMFTLTLGFVCSFLGGFSAYHAEDTKHAIISNCLRGDIAVRRRS
jgi:hypothetical protein